MWECICLLHRVDWHYYNFWFRMVTYIKGNRTLWLGGKSTKTTTTTRSNCNKWRHWNCIHSKWGNETLLFSACLQIYWAWKLYANWMQAAAATAEVPKALCKSLCCFVASVLHTVCCTPLTLNPTPLQLTVMMMLMTMLMLMMIMERQRAPEDDEPEEW